LFSWCWFIIGLVKDFNDFKDINDNYKLAAIAFKAAFLFFDDADLTNFNAADLTRLAGVDFLLFEVLRFTVACCFAVALLLVVVLRLKSAILLMI
jgi:hypothetical protein